MPYLRQYFLLCLFFFLLSAPASGRVYLDITSPDFRQVPVAIPGFEDAAAPGRDTETGRQLADLLGRALAFHGFLKIIPPSTYGGGRDRDWQKIGADFTVLGKYAVSGDQLTLELRLLDIIEGRMIFGRRYRGTIDRQRDMVLKFCDEVIMQLTGVRGISRSRIAYVSDASGHEEIYVSGVLGDLVRQVTRHRRLTVSPRFSPDGRRLAYTSYHPGNPDLYITDLDQDKTTWAVSRRPGLNLAPAWAPDGRTLAITLSRDGNPDLYLMTTRGVILERLTENAGINVSPVWSPDGDRLAFVSDRSGNPQVYIMEMESRRVSRLTFQGTDNTEPSWSPDGEWIAYSGLAGNNYQIFIIRPGGGPAVKLTSYRGNHESPSWSPDSRQVVFSRQYNGETKLYSVFRTGSGYRKLFAAPGNQTSPEWSVRLGQ